MEETSNNAIYCYDVLAENNNHYENQVGRNDLLPSHTDTGSEQGYDVFTHQTSQTIHRYLMDPETVLEGGCENSPEN